MPNTTYSENTLVPFHQSECERKNKPSVGLGLVTVAASKPENTCNALLCEELRKLGLEAWFEEQFLTRFGTSKPDVHVRWKDVNYFVEAKQKPKRLVDAVSKAYTYQKRLQVISPRAVFAVLYPPDCFGACDVAVLLNQPPFYISHSTSSLEALAKWIHGMVTGPPLPPELNTTDAIKLLREAVSGIGELFASVEARDVEDIFGGRVFFETVLGVKEETEIPVEYLRDAASYLLVNQILFYQILAREKRELIRYAEIDCDKIASPRDLHTKYFATVLLEDYEPIFGFDVVGKLKGARALEPIRVTVDAVNALSPDSLGHDILGKIFHNLIPLDLRKVIAAFYTNVQAGEILATLAVEDPDALVMDPACGSGTLLVSAYQRKRRLLEEDGMKFSFSDHKRFVEKEITGVDIMAFAAHLAAVHLSLQAPLYTTDFVRIAIRDSTGLSPGMTIQPAQEELKEAFKQRKLTDDFEKMVVRSKERVPGVQLSAQAESRPIRLGKVDLVIMNPPFTRFQKIPPAYKAKLSERFAEVKYQKCVHGQLGLHGYFLLLADRFIEEGGRLAAVLPVTTLSAKGFYDIQDIWFEDYSIEHVIACEGRSAFSENVLTREILLVAKKAAPRDNKVAVSVLRVSPDTLSIAEARSLSETLKQLRDSQRVGIIESENCLFRLIPQEQLAETKRTLFRAISMYRKDVAEIDEIIEALFKKSNKSTTFGSYMGSIEGEIHESPRGIKDLGYYALAVVSDENRALKKHDFWYVKEKTKRKLKVENRFSHVIFDIPSNSVLPNIRRYAGLSKFDITGETDYVVTSPFDGLTRFVRAAEIETTEREEALRNVRNGEWEKFVRSHSSRLALFYRIDITGVGTRNLAFYSDREMFFGGSLWNVEIGDRVQNKLLCLWFNSTLNLFQVLTDRKETRGGWIWLDDYVLREFVMPNLAKLTAQETSTLLDTFSRLGKQAMPSILEQLESRNDAREEIDRAFLRILGMSESEIGSFLERLYSVLAREIRTLKQVMAEGRVVKEDE